MKKDKTIQCKNGQRHDQTFHRRGSIHGPKTSEKFSTASIIKEMQFKTTTRYRFTPLRSVKALNVEQGTRILI